MKAITILKQVKTAGERADKYGNRIKTSLNIKMILPLEEEIEKIDDKVFDLENFALETNLNKGQRLMTKEDCEERFEEIINLKFKRTVKELELKAKKAAFEELFGEEEELETKKVSEKAKK